MRTELEHIAAIDRYLMGEMSGTELTGFETELKTNAQLREEVQHQQLVIKAIRRQSLMAEIQSVAASGSGSSFWTSSMTWVLSGILLTGLFVSWFVIQNYTTESEQETAIDHEDIVGHSKNGGSIAWVAPEVFGTMINSESDTASEVESNTSSSKTINSTKKTQSDNGSLRKPNLDETTLFIPPVKTTIDDASLEEEVKTETVVYEPKSKQLARFPIGDFKSYQASFQDYAAKNLVYPGTPKSKNLEGVVEVDFIVLKSGELSEVIPALISMNYAGEGDIELNQMQTLFNAKSKKYFEKRAYLFVSGMPIWEPATDSNGNRTDSFCKVIIEYRLAGCTAKIHCAETND